MNYEALISPRAAQMRPSGIRKFFDIAAEMEDCISLGVGEPDFKTPWPIRDAGIRSLERGRTFYTSNAGLKELREEICTYLNRRFGLAYTAPETLVTVGGSEAIDLCVRALVQPGDEVIIPEPCFVCYEPITTLTGRQYAADEAAGAALPVQPQRRRDAQGRPGAHCRGAARHRHRRAL